MKKFFSRTVGVEEFRVSLFVFSLLVFASFGVFSVASENFSGKNIFQDSDQDGLTNDEEALYGTDPQKADTDGDGYGDGAEIRSGYNPLKPSPGDKVLPAKESNEVKNKSSERRASEGVTGEAGTVSEGSVPEGVGGTNDADAGNLTEQVSQQIADILKKSSENSTDASTSIQAVQENLQKLLNGQDISEVTLPEVDMKDISVKKQDYSNLSEEDRKSKIKQDTVEYLAKVSYIMASHAPEVISSPDDMDKIAADLFAGVTNSIETGDMKYLDDLSEKGNQVLTELRNVDVPENMVDSHVKAIQLFRYAGSLRDEIKPSNTDPLANIVSFSKMQSFLGVLSGFVKQVDADIQGVGISEIPVSL